MRKVKTTPVLRQSADEHKPKTIIIRNSDGTFVFKQEEIVSIEACNNQVCFHVLAGGLTVPKIVVSLSLSKTEAILNHLPFMRVHRSWIINLAHVRAHLTKDGHSIETVTSQHIPVANSHSEQFVVAFEQFY